MVSKQAEQFLVELRMYLISKGKNDQEINEITEELEVHLTELRPSAKMSAILSAKVRKNT